jgi:drug/metabolite transporter (DMT)-like permease
MTAYFVLGEVLFPLQVLGGIGVIAAIVLLQMEKEKASLFSPIEIRPRE